VSAGNQRSEGLPIAMQRSANKVRIRPRRKIPAVHTS